MLSNRIGIGTVRANILAKAHKCAFCITALIPYIFVFYNIFQHLTMRGAWHAVC
jgi:hypothetical protein